MVGITAAMSAKQETNSVNNKTGFLTGALEAFNSMLQGGAFIAPKWNKNTREREDTI